MSRQGQAEFKARIKRINNPRNQSYYDPELQTHIPKHISKKQIRKDKLRKKVTVISLLLCLVLGAAALMIGQAVRFRYFELSGAGNLALFTEILVALLVGLTITAILRYRRGSHRIMQLTGAAAVFVAGHNLAWYYPDQVAVIYSAEYVEQVRQTTAARTVVFQGTVIAL